MNPWIKSLQIELEKQANAQDAFWMAKYMRNQFVFLGIKKPIQMQVFKQVVKSFPASENYLEIATELSEMPAHEYHYLSMVLVIHMKKHWDDRIPSWVEKMTLKYPWWDITDVLAPKILGPFFLKFPEQKKYFVDRWMNSGNIWLQRLCILYPLDYKMNLQTEELAAIILPLSSSKEFFIQKAIGWILRQYARSNPGWVRAFVQQHTLASLSKREALKHLT